MDMKWCPSCENNVTPKKQFSWLALILLAGIFYLPYYWFIKKPQCPCCGGQSFMPVKSE